MLLIKIRNDEPLSPISPGELSLTHYWKKCKPCVDLLLVEHGPMRGNGGEVVLDAEQEQMKERGIHSSKCGHCFSRSHTIAGSVLCCCLKERGDFLAATRSSIHFVCGVEWRLTTKRWPRGTGVEITARNLYGRNGRLPQFSMEMAARYSNGRFR